MSSTQEKPLAFADLTIDFVGRRLVRAGQVLALEPKAFDVLALLARSPGTAFTRDEILDAVWGHRHVTPGVLNRVMTLLRHALGEDAQSPRYLRTLHGVGYRFDLPMPEAPELGEGDPDASGDAPTAVPPNRGRRARDRWRAPLGLALVVALVLGLWAAREWGGPPTAPTRAPGAPPTLIVMPLRPIGAAGGVPDIADGLSEELIGELSRIDGLRVIARESTALAAAAGTPVADMDPRLGITHAVEGSLRQSGEALRVSIRLTEMASGRTLWAREFDRPAADVLVLQRDIAQAVASALALKLAVAPAPRGGDAQFLRRYFAARALILSPAITIDPLEQAELEFRELVFQRPDDARSHAGLAAALEARAFRRHPLAQGLRREAAREAALALRLDANQADAHGVQAAAACRQERWDACIDGYRHVLALAPSHSLIRYRYSLALAQLGYVQRAEAIARDGHRLDPLNPAWHFLIGRLLDTQGRHDEAHAQFVQTSSAQSPYGRWYNAVWRGDLAGAAAIAGDMKDDAPSGSLQLKPSYVAGSAALRDPARWPEAKVKMVAWEEGTGLMNFLHVFAPDADAAPLLDGLAATRRRSYSTWDLLVWTRDLAYLREGPAFQRYIAQSGILAYWRKHGFPPQCTPLADKVACR